MGKIWPHWHQNNGFPLEWEDQDWVLDEIGIIHWACHSQAPGKFVHSIPFLCQHYAEHWTYSSIFALTEFVILTEKSNGQQLWK